MASGSTDVAIVGAGPYGLSLAAHLRQRGVAFRIFGEPMKFWFEMRKGMYLKSFGFATNVYVPDGKLSFVEYCRERGLEEREPCAIADFARYGVWVQEQAVPELERAEVTRVAADQDGFRLTLSTGEVVRARQVVVAVGLRYFARMPEGLAGLPASVASHTSQHHEFARFAGQDVCVVGAGQSALEAAGALREHGARPRLLVRGSVVRFSSKTPIERPVWQRLRAPTSGLGPGLKSWLLETFPPALHYAPAEMRLRLVRRHLSPEGAWWVRDRVEGKIPIHTGCTILGSGLRGDRVVLQVVEAGKGEREIEADHVIAGTGFEVDVDRLQLLDEGLRGRIRRIERAPALNRHFESSVPGLFFVGAASVMSFGPLFRFVVGASYAAPRVARHLARQGGVLRASEVRLPA